MGKIWKKGIILLCLLGWSSLMFVKVCCAEDIGFNHKANLRLLLAELDKKEGELTKTEKKEFQKRFLQLAEKPKDTRSPYFLCKKNPWLNLSPFKFPDISGEGLKQVNLNMGINEYESFSFVITNFTMEEIKVKVKVKDNKNQFPIKIRQSYPIRTTANEVFFDPLPLLETLIVPPLQGREIWLTLHSKALQPGDYKIDLLVQPEGLPSSQIILKVKVYPINLPANPKDIPLYTYIWDYLPTQCRADYMKSRRPHGHQLCYSDRELQEEAREDLLAHYITVPFFHPVTLPWPTFDNKGSMKIDYTKFDYALNLWRNGAQSKMFGLFWGFGFFERDNKIKPSGYISRFGKDFMSKEWKENFSLWLHHFSSHLKEKGLTFDDFCCYMSGEHIYRDEYLKLYSFIKSIEPKVKIFVNPGEFEYTLDKMKVIDPYIDIWCLGLFNLDQWMNSTIVKERKKELELMKKKGKFSWNWAEPVYSPPPVSICRYFPYSYRILPWNAYKLGMRGAGFWTYLRYLMLTTDWNENEFKRQAGFDVVYLSDYAPLDVSRKEKIIPSRRWEAWREGVEDYIYLDMLEKAIKKAKAAAGNSTLIKEAEKVLKEWPEKVAREYSKRVQLEEANLYITDIARERIMEEILKLSTVNNK